MRDVGGLRAMSDMSDMRRRDGWGLGRLSERCVCVCLCACQHACLGVCARARARVCNCNRAGSDVVRILCGRADLPAATEPPVSDPRVLSILTGYSRAPAGTHLVRFQAALERHLKPVIAFRGAFTAESEFRLLERAIPPAGYPVWFAEQGARIETSKHAGSIKSRG